MNRWVLIYRFAWGLLIVFFAVGLLCIFAPKVHGLRSMHRKKGALEDDIAVLETKIQDLQVKQARFKNDPGFVEHTARQTGRVKPGEVVFKLTNGSERTNDYEP